MVNDNAEYELPVGFNQTNTVVISASRLYKDGVTDIIDGVIATGALLVPTSRVGIRGNKVRLTLTENTAFFQQKALVTVFRYK